MTHNRRAVLPAAFLALTLAACSSGTTSHGAPTTTTSATTPTSATTSTTTPTAPARWTALPPSPLTGRIAAGVVWTGEEMIVWGGVTQNGNPTAVADGAAYNPTTRTWRTIAPPPAGVRGDAGEGAVWTGDKAVFWAGNSPGGPAGGAVYDPSSNTWTRLPKGPLGAREGYASVWTGKELLIIGGASGDTIATPVAAAVNPRTGSWRLLPALDAVKGLQFPATVWTGTQVLLVGTRSLCPERGSACQRSEPYFASYDPATDALHAIDATHAPNAARRGASNPIAWAGGRALFANLADPAAGVLFYDPAANTWSTGKPPPCAVPDYSQTAWIGNRFVEACGADGVQVYDWATDAWQKATPGPSPLNSRSGSAIAWTGTSLIVWSGREKKPLNPAPNDGASLLLSK